MYTASVITVSDSAFNKLKEDQSGPKIIDFLKKNNFDVIYYTLTADEKEMIKDKLLFLADTLKSDLIITTGGTGFSKRDLTPEATKEVLEKETLGLNMLILTESLKITKKSALSRATSGIRNESLIINLPGSPKAVIENLEILKPVLEHALKMVKSTGSNNCLEKSINKEEVKDKSLKTSLQSPDGDEKTEVLTPLSSFKIKGKVESVNISLKTGLPKTPVDFVNVIKDFGIKGDVHAGTPNRNISLLSLESVEKMREKTKMELSAGSFAENILISGFCLYTLPLHTKMMIGDISFEVTQIGKTCHTGCAIREIAGDCVMPREGIFVRALNDGIIKAGDEIIVL